MKHEDIERLIERARNIGDDAMVDASLLDGQPFTGRIVAENFGQVLAMINALADTLALVLTHLDPGVGSQQRGTAMTVGELRDVLAEYGDHLEVKMTDDDLTEFAPIERVDTVTRDGEVTVVLIAE